MMRFVFASGLLIFALASLSPREARAQSKEYPWSSGNAFLRLCGGEMPSAHDGDDAAITQFTECINYVHGVADGVSALGFYVENKTKAKFQGEICIPDGVDNQQLIRVSVAYMQSRPDQLQVPSSWLIHAALIRAFGCKPDPVPVPPAVN